MRRVFWIASISVCLFVFVTACSTTPIDTNDNSSDNTSDNSSNDNTGAPRCVTGADGGETTVSYNEDLVPILANRGCLSSACHGGSFLQSDYDLRTYEGIFGPGDQAVAFDLCNVVPGDPDASYLIEKLSPNPRFGSRMPENRTALTDDEIEMIRTWIAEGAQDN